MSVTLSAQDTPFKTKFLEQFADFKANLNGHSQEPLAIFCKDGHEALLQTDFPDRTVEDWKYSGSPIQRMLEQHYAPAGLAFVTKEQVQQWAIPDLAAISLVFVNGQLAASLSSDTSQLPDGLVIQTMDKALADETTRQWIYEQLAHEGGTAQNTFLPLNQAFASHGLYIATSRNAVVSTPIHCLYITTSTGQAHHCHPQHFVKAAAGSQLTILESFHDLEEATPSFINAATHIEVAANAHLHYYRLQGAGRESLVVNNTIVRQHRDSVFSHYALDLGGKVVRNNLAATHLDSNLETHYYGVYFGNGNQHIDNQTFIDHAMPHCQSNELYKGIMTDYARGVFNGKVTVRQDAQKTNAFQQNSSLVLSANAIMDTKPQLEIFADDVRCSHGATVGQLDESSVFYLRSRGLSPANARRLLQEAFLGEVVDNMPHEAIRTYAHQLITDKFA